MQNETKRQHFISQAEQSLNASNPNAKPENMMVYKFEVVDRDDFQIELTNSKGVKIGSNLFDIDIYSFDILSKKERLNFESAFGKYEKDIPHLTNCLIAKLESRQDVGTELLDIFAHKLLNIFRNPFCIKKTLNTLSEFLDYYPADLELLELYNRIDNGIQPHAASVSNRYNVSVVEYKKWLKILFWLTMASDGEHPDILEPIVKSIYRNSEVREVFVQHYTNDACVLFSDRGFSEDSVSGKYETLEFNLTSKVFLIFCLKPKGELLQGIIKENEMIKVSLIAEENNIEKLGLYNQNVIKHAKENVYSASTQNLHGVRLITS